MLGTIASHWTHAALAVAVGVTFVAKPSPSAAQGGPGFLFREPIVTLRIETGYDLQFANSQVFDQTRTRLTVSPEDFWAPYVGGELAIHVGDRWDVGAGAGYSRSTVLSESRPYVDNLGNPIEQETSLRVVPVAVTAKYYFRDRGRRVSRFAWVPEVFTPYVGAALGVVSYRFGQVGDFVYEESADLPVYYDALESSGSAPLVRGLLGASLSVGAQFELFSEARYTYAHADMNGDFDNFDPIDLSGLQGAIGIGIRF